MTRLRFWAGGPVRQTGYFYVDREEDAAAIAALAGAQYCHIVGPRQIGKTSLAVRAAEHLRKQGFRTARISLDGLGSGPAEEWVVDLVENLTRGLDVPGWEALSQQLKLVQFPAEQRFSLVLERLVQDLPEKAVVFLDEIDVILEPTSENREFFLRTLADAHARRTRDVSWNRITFCLIGVTPPSELLSGWGEGIFTLIRLRDFTHQQAQVFAPGFETLPVTLEAAYEVTLGHPHMLQRMGEALTDEEIPFCSFEQLLREVFHERYNQFDVVKKYFEGKARSSRWSEMLRLYESLFKGDKVSYQADDFVHATLEMTGLVAARFEATGQYLAIRNPVYRRNFDERWIKEVKSSQAQERNG